MTETNAPTRRRRWRRRLLIAAGAVAAYALLGFVAAPPLIRSTLVKRLSAELQRPVAVAHVALNPFALSVTIDGLAVADRDGAPLAGWDRLYVRLRPWSAFSKELGLAEVALVRPAVRLALGKDGRPSFQDLLDRPAGPAPAPPEPGSKPWGLYLGHLGIEEARLTFEDATRTPLFRKVLGPVSFRLDHFRTRPDNRSPYAFQGATESGERIEWSGEILTDPLRSSGKVALERFQLDRYQPYTRDEAPAEVRAGLASFHAGYEIEWGPARRAVRIADARLDLEGLRIGRPGVAEDDLALPAFEISGVAVDALAPSADIGLVALRGGVVKVLRSADGALNLLALAARPPASRPASPAPDAPGPASAAPASKPFDWKLAAVAVEGLRVEWQDGQAPRPVSLALDPVALKLEKLEGRASSVWPVDFRAGWPGRGTLSAKGSIAPFEQRGDLAIDLDGLDLAPVAPYADSGAARLTGGRLFVKGRATFDLRPRDAPRATFAGDVRLDDLAAAEPVRGEELARWRSLEISGIDAGISPVHARVKAMRLVEPAVRVVKVAGPAAPPAPAPAPAKPEEQGAPLELSLGTFQIQRGRVTFVDRTIQPAVTLDTSDIEVKITGLSSEPRARSTVNARARLFGAAPVTVKGTLNPLQARSYTDLTIQSKAIDLTPLGPYAGRYVGYGLQKGKLDLDVKLKIDRRALQGQNVAKIDQLALGEKVSSPDATSLPVKLALAVLQDRQGVILLDLPVEGNLDDPDFRVGRIVWRAVLNVLTKVITSPFAALAALVGGSKEDLSVVELPPGSAALDDDARKRIASLTQALEDRPALGLEVEATVDEVRDLEALRRAALAERLKQGPAGAKTGLPDAAAPSASGAGPAAAEAAAAGAASASARAPSLALPSPESPPPALAAGPSTPTATPAAETLASTAEAKPPVPGIKASGPADGAPEAAPPGAAEKTPTLEEEAALLAAIDIPPEALRALAAERAEKARAAFLAAGIDPSRLFLVDGGERAKKEGGARVYFTLR